jgi:signal peptidase I
MSEVPVEPGWGALLLASACRALLAILATLTVLAVAPAAWGWESSVVRSGSMAPAVRVGDVLVVRPATPEQLVPGQVLVVEDPDHAGELRAHRLVGVLPDGRLKLKGDANQTADSTPVDPEDLRGVGVLNVPKVGMVDVWLSTQDWKNVAVCLLGLMFLEAGRRRDRPRSSHVSARRRSQRLMLAGTAKAVALGLLVLFATSGSDEEVHAAFKGTSVSAANQLGAAATFYPYRTAVLADGPNRFWRLSETLGNAAADASGNGRTGTYSNTYALSQPSALSWDRNQLSVSFTSGGLVAAASETAPAAFSVEAFIKTTSTSGGRIVGFGNRSGANQASQNSDRHLYLTPTGRVALGIESSTTKQAIVSPLSYNNGAWHHLVGTYNPATGQPTSGLRLYVDGAQVAFSTSVTAPTSYSGFWRAAFEDLAGWPNAPTSQRYVGQLDEIAIYYSVLTAARVAAHYSAATQP